MSFIFAVTVLDHDALTVVHADRPECMRHRYILQYHDHWLVSNTDSSDGLSRMQTKTISTTACPLHTTTTAEQYPAPIKALSGADDHFTGTVHSDYDDFLYQNYHRAAFSAHRDWYTDSTAESGVSIASCPVFDILYYVADLSAD